MANEKNLALNIDTVGSADKPKAVARIAVVSVNGYLRDGSAPVISRDCATQRELTKEIDRLKDELDGLLAGAGDHFGTAQRPKQSKRSESGSRPVAASAATAEKPHVMANLNVADVMTRDVKTVRRNDPLTSADALMDSARFRHVVVVDERDKLEGIISHRDMFYSRLTRSMGQGKYAHEKALDAFMVKQIMQTDVTTVDPETPLADAAALMMEEKIGCLPVLDGDAVAGILTESDFLGILSPAGD